MKTGDLVSLKTTGELVYVLEIATLGTTSHVRVRRPKLSDAGIEHAIDTFLEDELETVEQHIAREAQEAFLKVKAQRMIFGKQLDELEVQTADVPEIADPEKPN